MAVAQLSVGLFPAFTQLEEILKTAALLTDDEDQQVFRILQVLIL